MPGTVLGYDAESDGPCLCGTCIPVGNTDITVVVNGWIGEGGMEDAMEAITRPHLGWGQVVKDVFLEGVKWSKQGPKEE